jgi:hypothetical protein
MASITNKKITTVSVTVTVKEKRQINHEIMRNKRQRIEKYTIETESDSPNEYNLINPQLFEHICPLTFTTPTTLTRSTTFDIDHNITNPIIVDSDSDNDNDNDNNNNNNCNECNYCYNNYDPDDYCGSKYCNEHYPFA